MSLIRPFAGLRPLSEYATAVLAPPYDVLNSTEARHYAEGNPWSFLHISKPEIDLLGGVDPYSDVVYQKGLDNLRRFCTAGVLKQELRPCYYLYELTLDSHRQVGIVAVASVAAYREQRIRRHELTRPDKETDRVRHIDSLNAQTGPALLFCKPHADLEVLLTTLTAKTPEIRAKTKEGVTHTLWIIDEVTTIQTITDLFETMEHLYIADGHHRSAAAARIADLRQTRNPHHTGEEAYNYFLTVTFPANQMQILDYNRLIKDLNGFSVDEFLKRVAEHFTVDKSALPVKPKKQGEFGLFLQGQWYQITIHPDKVMHSDPVASLDVSVLAHYLIEPILGITDPRRDQRIDFVGGARGLTELERRVSSGEMAVAFALYPTGLESLMAVADAGCMMPPKSTWFEPKLADGLVSHLLD